jgi:hypothetical protein
MSALFHPDAVEKAEEAASEKRDEAGPVRQRQSHAEQHDQESRVRGMSHEARQSTQSGWKMTSLRAMVKRTRWTAMFG